MEMPSDKELLEFMKKNYGPEWAKPEMLELARMLWQKKYGNKYVASTTEYPKVKISEVQRGAGYTVEGIVLNVEKAQYQGCPICKRSAKRPCEHIQKGEVKPVWLVRFLFLISDGTGQIKVDGVFESDKVPDVQIGDLVEVKGFVSTRSADLRMVYNGHEVKRRISSNGSEVKSEPEPVKESVERRAKPDPLDDFGWSNGNGNVKEDTSVQIPYKIYNILNFIQRVGSIAERPLQKMASHEGVEWNELLKYIEDIGNGKYKVRSDIDLSSVKVT